MAPLDPSLIPRIVFLHRLWKGLMVGWGALTLVPALGSLWVLSSGLPERMVISRNLLYAAVFGGFVWVLFIAIRNRTGSVVLTAAQRKRLGRGTTPPSGSLAERLATIVMVAGIPVILELGPVLFDMPLMCLGGLVTPENQPWVVAAGGLAFVGGLGVNIALVRLGRRVDRAHRDGDLASATSAMDKAGWWIPGRVAQPRRARLSVLCGDFYRAETYSRSVLGTQRIAWRHAQVLPHLVASLSHQKRFAEAQDAVDAWVALVPSDPVAHVHQALLEIASDRANEATARRVEAAMRLAIRGFRTPVHEQELLALLAWTLAAAGDDHRARTTLDSVAPHNAEPPIAAAQAHFYVARARHALWDLDEALGHYNVVVDRAPQLHIAKLSAAAVVELAKA
ncbi:MAG: hypothetical protein AB8H79_12560 [Myxococcota bacterium]